MSADDFYRLQGPTAWRTTVDLLSFSSLKTLERCPRQWQLLRSEWPGFDRFPRRPSRAAIEGTLVHEMLDRVFRAMAMAGLPRPGSPEFRAVLSELDVLGRFRREIDAENAALEGHPRAASLRVQAHERALYNRMAALFQKEYAGAEAVVATGASHTERAASPAALLASRGVLTEWSVKHPTLPLHGVIDLVRRDRDGTHIIDFKTGEVRPEYRDQLALYALLWWRATGDLAASMELRHPRGHTAFGVDRRELEALETSLGSRIERVRRALEAPPAEARLGTHCGTCDARPFCAPFWEALPEPDVSCRRTQGEFVDVELVVGTPVADNGFSGVTRGKRALPVVYEDEVASIHGPFVSGERLRVLGALLPAGEPELRLTRASEVYRKCS